MPGRYTIALILLFFVGMAGWQWMRTASHAAGEGPQLKRSLELAAEDGTTNWKITFNQNRLGDAQTRVAKTPNGVFQLHQEVLLDGDLEAFLGPVSTFAKLSGIKLNDYRATIRTDMDLTYLGTMRRLNLTFLARSRPVLVIPGSAEEKKQRDAEIRRLEKEESALLNLNIVGEVLLTDELNFRGSFSFANARLPIDDVKMKYRSKESFFSNIAPTDCLADIRLGQRWETPVIDPTQMMFAALAKSETKKINIDAINVDDVLKTKVTEVRVLDELQEMTWDNTKVPCYVVQSSERGSTMQLWVNATNFRVLKQTIKSDRSLLEMVREPKKDE